MSEKGLKLIQSINQSVTLTQHQKDMSLCSNWDLTHYGLVPPYGNIDMDQHWPDGATPLTEQM